MRIGYFRNRQGVRRAGTNRSNRLIGSAGRDILQGLAGSDRLTGDRGNDRLDGGRGNDRLDGGRGNDLIVGGEGGDRLLGGQGNDILVGGTGADVLIGSSGKDLFKFNAVQERTDHISDFNSTDDLIDLRSIFASSAFAGNNAFERFQQFVQLVQVGRATEVRIDADGLGMGTTFVTLITLQNVSVNAVTSRQFVVI